MQFSAVLIIAAAAVAPVFGQTGTGGAHQATAVVTRTVTAYETYCPKATTFVVGTKTYTATKEEWVTVKNCPKKCTITYNPSKPTVVPIGEAPKYGNATVPACPCPKGKECPCDNTSVVGGSTPLTNGSTAGVPGTAGDQGDSGSASNLSAPGTTGTGSNPSGSTPGSNTGADSGSNPGVNADGTLIASSASVVVPGALLNVAAFAVFML